MDRNGLWCRDVLHRWFFDFLYETRNKPDIKVMSDIDSGRGSLRRILCIDRLDQISEKAEAKCVDLSPAEREPAGAVKVKRYEIRILPNLTMPFWILSSGVSNNKAVLYCHGHDKYGAKGAFIYHGKTDVFHRFVSVRLAEQGYTVIIPEFIGFGEMQYNRYKQEDQRGCYSNSALALLSGYNIAGLRVFQAMKMLDHITDEMGFSDVSVFGTSGGGLISAFLGAVDDRPECVVVSNYGASLKSCIMAMHHCIDNYVPGYLKLGEVWDILSLICPKRLLLTSGAEDPIFPMEGVLETAQKVREVYDRLGFSDRFKLNIHNGGHEVSVTDVLDFLM